MEGAKKAEEILSQSNTAQLLLISEVVLTLEAQEVMKQGGTKLCSPQTCNYGLKIIKVKPQKLLLNCSILKQI